jgi:hypothetical protein
MTDTYHSAENHEPWDRIPGEPDKAFHAFECYLDMSYWERKDLYAYRNYVGNPEAPHVSTTWSSWKEEFFWEERARAYDNHIQKERREQTIQAQVESGYELGDELAEMEQRMFHIQELLYEKAREKLEEDDLSEWRPMDLVNLLRVMNEGFAAIKKARSLEKSDPYEEFKGFTPEEIEQFWEKKAPNQRRAEEDAWLVSPRDDDADAEHG